MSDAHTTAPDRCLTCHWWGLRDSASIPECNRQCHRFPPVATRDADGERVTEWPWTNQNDYCGEHRHVDRNGIQQTVDDLATQRALAGLDEMASAWAQALGIPEMVAKVLAMDDRESRVEALMLMAWTEGAYAGRTEMSLTEIVEMGRAC